MMTSGARGEAGAGADVLESTRMVSMLLYLYENGESRRMEIYNAVGRNNRLPDKLDVLRDMGLVYYGGDNPSRSTIGLTDLGVHVAPSSAISTPRSGPPSSPAAASPETLRRLVPGPPGPGLHKHSFNLFPVSMFWWHLLDCTSSRFNRFSLI